MPDTHHIYGPSTLGKRAICAGWMNDKYSSKEKADEGELMHKASETGNLAILQTEEQKHSVQMCLDYVGPLETFARKIHKEKTVRILDGKTFGTSDRIIERFEKHGVHVDVVDFKFGLWAVEPAEENLQGFAYVLGAFDLVPDAQTVRVHFLCPRQDVVDTATFTRKDYGRLALKVALVVDRAAAFENLLVSGKEEQAWKMLNPTEEGCLFCGRKATCPAVRKYALTTASKYAPLEVVPETHSSKVTDPAQMAKMLDAARLLEKMASSIKTHAMEMAEKAGGLFDANGVPLYQIAERAGSRKIKDLGLALPVLGQYLTDRELLAVSDISLPAALKLIADKAPSLGKKKSHLLGEVEKQLKEADAIVTLENGSRYLRRVKE